MASGHKIIALHGFLGLASDWERFHDFHARNLWQDVREIKFATDMFAAWTTKFLDELTDEKVWLIGYSMGGRLSMHALLRAPEKFAGAVLISANPGLAQEAERTVRIEGDAKWAARFSNEPWSNLMTAWNSQPVLKTPPGAPPAFERREADFDRSLLASAMNGWSLGRQQDLRHDLSRLNVPILYLTGSEDAKFTSLVAGLARESGQRYEIIAGAGHRVPWDKPQEFVISLSTFLEATDKFC